MPKGAPLLGRGFTNAICLLVGGLTAEPCTVVADGQMQGTSAGLSRMPYIMAVRAT